MVLKNLLAVQWLGVHSLTAEGLHSKKENGPPPKIMVLGDWIAGCVLSP